MNEWTFHTKRNNNNDKKFILKSSIQWWYALDWLFRVNREIHIEKNSTNGKRDSFLFSLSEKNDRIRTHKSGKKNEMVRVSQRRFSKACDLSLDDCEPHVQCTSFHRFLFIEIEKRTISFEWNANKNEASGKNFSQPHSNWTFHC